jgi:hypothetical protein
MQKKNLHKMRITHILHVKVLSQNVGDFFGIVVEWLFKIPKSITKDYICKGEEVSKVLRMKEKLIIIGGDKD